MILLLDSEAISAESHGPAARRAHVRAVMAEARGREAHVATSAAVIAELVRGRPQDAAVHATLQRERIDVVPLDGATAGRAGALLEAVGSGSEDAVDAFLVATADRHGTATVLTQDVGDIDRLASWCRSVVVAALP